MSPEGEVNQAKSETVEDQTSPLHTEYNAIQVARADFGVTPDLPITKPAADTYYVNNGTQPWRATQDNTFVPPADNKTSDPYFNPGASRPWKADPYKKGGTEFRRPDDPKVLPQDQNDPNYRPPVIPNQSYLPEQYTSPTGQFIPGYVAPSQQFTQFDQQNRPDFLPQYTGSGIPAYSGMGFNFTNNFYNVGERPSLTYADMSVVPRATDNIPAIKINTAFPNQTSFFGVPLVTSSDAVIKSPNAITIPSVDSTLPLSTLPVRTTADKFEPGVVPITKDTVPSLTNLTNLTNLNGIVTADQTKPVVVNPVVSTIPVELGDPNKPGTKTNIAEVRPITTVADQSLVVQPDPNKVTLPGDSSIPATNVLVPVDQKAITRADETQRSLYNETYRYATAVPAFATYWLSNPLPRNTEKISAFAAKWSDGKITIPNNVNVSAKFRDPSGAIVGLTAYELAHKAITWGNSTDSVVGNVTVPAGILAYRALSPNATNKPLAAVVAAGTAAATYFGDKLVPGGMKDTTFGTHTWVDDTAMVGGMYLANTLKTPAALAKLSMPAAAERFIPSAIAKAVPGALGSGLFKVGVLATTFVAGNFFEAGFNYLFPGTKTLASRAQSAMDSDSTARTADSLAAARKSFSTLSDSQWSAAQAELAKVKSERDALASGQNNWEQRAIGDRKVMILAAAIGENYLNHGTRVSNQGNTFIGEGADIDLNSQALASLRQARDVAYRLIRKYDENVLPATINGTPVNKTAEVAALKQEIERINGVMKRVYEPHDYEAAMPGMVKAANEKPEDFFTNFVKYNDDNAKSKEQSLRSQGYWDSPDSAEERRSIAKMNRDKAYALLVLAQRALDVNAGREAVNMLIGIKGNSDPTMNARSALNSAISQFRTVADNSSADNENINRLKAIFARLNAQIKAKFPAEYAAANP